MDELFNNHNSLIEKYSESHPNITSVWKNIVLTRKNRYEELLKESIKTLNKLEDYDNDITNEDIMTLFILFNSKSLNINE